VTRFLIFDKNNCGDCYENDANPPVQPRHHPPTKNLRGVGRYRWQERHQAGDVELAMHMRILYNNDEALMIGVC
jgi:hypothetical protein